MYDITSCLPNFTNEELIEIQDHIISISEKKLLSCVNMKSGIFYPDSLNVISNIYSCDIVRNELKAKIPKGLELFRTHSHGINAHTELWRSQADVISQNSKLIDLYNELVYTDNSVQTIKEQLEGAFGDDKAESGEALK